MGKRLLVLVLVLPLLAAGQQDKNEDVWASFRFLEGVWEGRGDGMSGISKDIVIFSFDSSREKFVLRGFYIEGFVNQYVGEKIPKKGTTFTFVTEDIENAPQGTKAKLVFKKIDEGEFEQSFHVAWPGRECSCYSTNTLKKKR